jgi:hypothetical protein
MVPRAQNRKVVDDYRAVIRKSALASVRDGMSPDDAVAAATKGYFDGHYYTETRSAAGSTIRMPIDMRPAASSIIRGLDYSLKDTKASGIDLMTVDKSLNYNSSVNTPEKYANSIKRNGRWITNPDNAGVTLYDGDGFVVKKNGKPITLNWAQAIMVGKTADPALVRPSWMQPAAGETPPWGERQ